MGKNNRTHYKSVMIIDDNKIDRYVVEMVIKKNNFADEVIKMESGMEALDFISSKLGQPDELPELILLDINMPEMNGFEFMEQYNLLPTEVKNCCIIMMLTTSIHPIDIERANNNQYVLKFINKPLNTDKLKELTTAE